MGAEGIGLHILFFPLMAPGHMLPMVDIAKLAAARGVRATVLTTPANTHFISHTIDLANASLSIPISIRLIPLPPVTGLHPGHENFTSFYSKEDMFKLFGAISKLRDAFDDVLRDLRPDCVVSDSFLPWTREIAAAYGIPRVVFHGSNFFSMCAMHAVQQHKVLENAPPEATSVVISGLPHRIELLRSQFPDITKTPPDLTDLKHKIREADNKSFGAVVNSFYELEAEYYEYFTKEMGHRAWHVGPVSFCNRYPSEMRARGTAEEEGRFLCWLDRQSKPYSVLYACFGSISVISGEQLREMALGVEAAGYPFILVVRSAGGDWIPEGFEERVEGKGLVVREWAPQMEILAHRATGGFMTHCGWNSSLEGICAGLPMATWPLFAEQFYNERLLVDVLKVGLRVGSTEYLMEQEEMTSVVRAAEVEAAVREVMGEGEQAEKRRRRARKMGEMARRAAEEGGSSYEDIGSLLRDLKELQTGNEDTV